VSVQTLENPNRPAHGRRVKRLFHRGLALAFAAASALAPTAAPTSPLKEPQRIILDTDMGPDCDDVGALFILHGAIERGEATLLGTIGCVSADSIAPALDAINSWFGRPEIPVGTLKDPGFLAGPHFTKEIAKRYPHKFRSGADYPDATALYRQLLAKEADGGVVILAIGPLRNLAHLLKSRPDSASPLDGVALVSKKVKRLDVMGGNYPPEANTAEAEWNFKQDPGAAAFVCSNWPTPMLFNGEGGSTCSGRRVTYEMPEHNPLTMAYRLYPGAGFAGDRLSWDSLSSLVATRGASPWFRVVSNGFNAVDPVTGMNTWRTNEDRRHSYLIMSAPKAGIEQALEDMQTAGKGRPRHLNFNTAYYAKAGMCRITCHGAADADASPMNAFDADDRTVWRDRAAASWIQCQYVDGRKYLVSSYVVFSGDPRNSPRRLELSGSNDGGASWTRLDVQENPAFTAQTPRREFTIVNPRKWNAYRLGVTAANEEEGVRITEIELNDWIDCNPGIEAAGLTLDQLSLHLPTHGRATVNATITPLGAELREVAWESDDPSVAEVRRIGEQIAVVVARRPGTCSITARVGKVNQTFPVTVAASTLPAGWSCTGINQPPIPGSAVVDHGLFSITGCGHAMSSWWERVRDQGVFVHRAVTPDFEISARISTPPDNVGGPTFEWDNRPSSASGLMLRESLAENCSRFFLVQVEATGELVCRWRDETGNQDDNQRKGLGKVTLPIHLRLRQTLDNVEVFTSQDGQKWGEARMIHPAMFKKGGQMGLFVCSGNTFASTTAAFDSVQVNP
jgi:Inosine-uridine preferring nucleoside hydrolase